MSTLTLSSRWMTAAWLCSAVFCGTLFQTSAALAQHAGDIEMEIISGKLTTSANVFESDFIDFGSIYFTDEPGFDSLPGTFATGDQVGFNVTQKLWYWDGTQLTTPASDPPLTISFGPNSREVDSMTEFVSGFLFPAVTAGDAGQIHRHIDFEMPISAEIGAYGLVMELWSPQYSTSDEFLIVFNNGLELDPFEEGVTAISDAAFAAVPEPAAIALWVSGAGILAALAICRRRVALVACPPVERRVKA